MTTRASAHPSSVHPSDDTLMRMACNELDAAERAALEAHLESCEDCQAIWSAVEKVQAEAATFDPGAIPQPNRRFRSPAGRHRPLLGLVAASLLASVLFFWQPWSIKEPLENPPQTVRSSPELKVPSDLRPAEGEQLAEPDFAWTGVKNATSYTVELIDDEGQPLWTSDRLVQTTAPWPAELEQRPGSYFWRVSATLADNGNAFSPLTRFELVAE